MCGVNLDLLKGGAPGVPGFCGESAKGYWNSLPRSTHTELLPGVHVKVAFRISIRSVLWVLQRFSFEIKDDCTFEWRLNLDLSGNWEKGSKNSAHRQLNAKHETSKIYVTCNISKRFNIRWQIAYHCHHNTEILLRTAFYDYKNWILRRYCLLLVISSMISSVFVFVVELLSFPF